MKYDFRTGYVLPLLQRVIAGLFLLGFTYRFLLGFEWILLPFIVLMVAAFVQNGVYFDQKNNQLRTYYWLYGLRKYRENFTFSEFPFIAVLSVQVKKSVLSQGQVSMSRKDMEYRVVVLNITHYQRVHIQHFSTEEDAMEMAKGLETFCGLRFTVFSPDASRTEVE